jgi:hypothetical protein
MEVPMRGAKLGLALILSTTMGSGSAPAQTASTIPPPKPVATSLPPAPSAPDYMWPRMYEHLSPSLRDDPRLRAEISRLMLEAMFQQVVQALGQDGDHPAFMPHLSYYMNVAQPNADTIYKRAVITPGGVYRLRGRLGSLTIFKMAQLGATPDQTGGGVRAISYNDFAALKGDASGQFDVLLSPARPAGYTGAWWKLDPNASSLLLRQVSQDWAKERDPAISIERVDIPVRKERTSAQELEKRLDAIPRQAFLIAAFLVNHAEQMRAEGFVNKLRVFDVSNGGALEGQFYYEGVYDLQPDEALIVEAKVPARCRYSSMILTNPIYETTNWIDNHSSLNGSQYRVDKDGVLRVVIANRDPGVANWLDTAGYPTGVVQGRWTECDAQPVPTARKVRIADLARELPAGTARMSAKEREQALRNRRAAVLQRSLW